MRIALLVNRRRARLRLAAKAWLTEAYGVATRGHDQRFVPPDYESFASFGDEPPAVFGTGDPIPWRELGSCDILIWEWGWTAASARTVVDIHRRAGLPTLVYPGPIDRFWTEVDPDTLVLHREAAGVTGAVGVMSGDRIGFYQAMMPWARVCHLPVPVDTEFLKSYAPDDDARDRNLVLLTAPTAFIGRSSQLPISSLAAFLHLRTLRPDCRGLCFAYSAEEASTANRVIDIMGLRGIVQVERFRRPLQRYLRLVASCGAGLFLPRAEIQGRTAMIAAATGLPMVLSDEVEDHRVLFPHTVLRWTEATQAGALCSRLLTEPDFRSLVRRTAASAVNYYGLAACRDRFASIANAVSSSWSLQ
jgi:hypothetical protein